MPKRPPDEGRLIQLVYYLYVAGSALARALPENVAYGAADLAGTMWARRAKRQRAQARRNLSRITGMAPGSPQLERVVDDAFRSYARYWLETFRLVREERSFFLDRFRASGEEKLDLTANGKAPVIVVGHLGNYDAAGAWVAARGQTVTTVAEVLRPRRMFDFFVAHRRKLGIEILPAETGATGRLVEALDRGRIVAILGDRDLKGKGPRVELFGETTTLPAGAASIALRTGAPLLVAGVYGARFEDGKRGWTADIFGPLPVPDAFASDAVETLTQEIARHLETCIAKQPAEWHVFQPFWLADRGVA